MLSGKAVVAIWNDITAEGRAEFYAWHLHEHMPERAAIPGFLRGRRYIAADASTRPEFFTLYETESLDVLTGPAYLARLNAPTPWTRIATAAFRNTSRALATVRASHGPGPGGALLTLRVDAPAGHTLAAVVEQAASQPRMTGAHLCAGDPAASGTKTAETAGRTDIQTPPTTFLLIEATDPAALAALLPDEALHAAGVTGPIERGCYRLEYARGKDAIS